MLARMVLLVIVKRDKNQCKNDGFAMRREGVAFWTKGRLDVNSRLVLRQPENHKDALYDRPGS